MGLCTACSAAFYSLRWGVGSMRVGRGQGQVESKGPAHPRSRPPPTHKLPPSHPPTPLTHPPPTHPPHLNHPPPTHTRRVYLEERARRLPPPTFAEWVGERRELTYLLSTLELA